MDIKGKRRIKHIERNCRNYLYKHIFYTTNSEKKTNLLKKR